MTLKELATASVNGQMTVNTGGLGKLTEAGRFSTWACVQPHECGNDSKFCFVYDKVESKFIPWGKMEELGLSMGTCTS
eukprot:CAMPEP_0206279478 /NCGR_PEP_ID=MMETSP0047_2-20121206/38040_1 /ASSEMBLY_ACC=CAM_ASM_000192 /TAXON_ID=195065 /ORGANISM="Chroomonas mesostigmatica_cf, Strain CCMP1168" /LENGTH=77 /DNA_ID=CAMNT_0053709423 /DNA_START=901 /DNA_END=1134 /DNA_ORIENTATION=+